MAISVWCARKALLAGVPGGFSRGSPPTDWPVSFELK